MVVQRCLHVRALLTRLIRLRVSTYIITHDANGFQCDVTAEGGRVVPTALEVDVQEKSGERWMSIRNRGVCAECGCLYSMCVYLRVFQCVCMRACAASV